MAFDFSTLPKARSHAYMGSLGEEPCGWNPTTWPNCINVYRNARREFQENYTRILQMENTYHITLQNLQSQEPSPARDEMLALTNERLQEVTPIRQQGVAIANQLEAKIQEWSWIPGFDTVFLNGLRGGRLGALGNPLLVPVGGVALVFYIVAGVVGVTSLAYIVGEVAQAWSAAEQATITKHNAYGKCLEVYDRAVAQGLRGDDLPTCGEQPVDTDWTTIALIGGSLFLVMMLMKK